jgi:hypothetical protein
MVGNQPTRLVYGKDDDSFWEKYPVLETFRHATDSFVKHIGKSSFKHYLLEGFRY